MSTKAQKPKKILPGNNQGHSLVEMLLSLMLVLIFAITAFSLIFSGSQTYASLQRNKDNSADARIIESTFLARIHQYDYENGVQCVDMDWNGETVQAVIFNEYLEDAQLKTWLFWHDGSLYEGLTLDDEVLTSEIVQLLMSNDELRVGLRQDGNRLFISVDYPFGDEVKTLSISYWLRSL